MRFDGRVEDPWHDAVLEAPYTAGTPVPQYRIDDVGTVHLRGQVVRNAAATGDLAFELPEMYWPTATMRPPLWSAPGTSTCRASIATTGEVTLHQLAGTVTDYFIDCSFSTY